jgi:hypothetical protein
MRWITVAKIDKLYWLTNGLENQPNRSAFIFLFKYKIFVSLNSGELRYLYNMNFYGTI